MLYCTTKEFLFTGVNWYSMVKVNYHLYVHIFLVSAPQCEYNVAHLESLVQASNTFNHTSYFMANCSFGYYLLNGDTGYTCEDSKWSPDLACRLFQHIDKLHTATTLSSESETIGGQ